jgi:uncharacterized protein (UPF0276 family)
VVDETDARDVKKKRFSIPNLGVGVGLRTVHYAHILDEHPAVDWFELLSENYMHTEGRPREVAARVSAAYPIAMHGVSMSIGSADPLDWDYLRELRALRDLTHARWVSDHLCWTGVAGKNAHDLLPMPYTEEALRHVTLRVKEVQDFLDAPLALENPSTYLELAASTMTEQEFIARLAEEADCALLLDVNNVYVSAKNHGFSADDYLAVIPWERVVQFHVAGHSDHGTHCIDTHIGPVIDPVWDLLGEAYVRAGGASVLLEWDAEIPAFDVVHREALRAKEAIARAEARRKT